MVNPKTLKTVSTFFPQFIRNHGEVKSALVTVTTECNAKCVEKCDIWKEKPVEMSREDAKIAIDFLVKNGYQIIYFTGGEATLWRHLVGTVDYAKEVGLVTSLTTNGTISSKVLERLNDSLDVISVSVDHYDPKTWDMLKHVDGISEKAVKTIQRVKELGMKGYSMTFLGPELTKKPGEIEKMVNYVNNDLGIAFGMCFPFISKEQDSFCVGGELHEYLQKDSLYIKKAVEKLLELKLSGSKIATPTPYMRDIIKAYDGKQMRYPCRAGSTVISIDYNLDVYPCFKKVAIFNIRKSPSYNLRNQGICRYDDKSCLINCFKEPSLLSRGKILSAATEEFFSNPSFYLSLLS